MRVNLGIAIAVGLAVAAATSAALELKFPKRSQVRASVIVDELGSILFGTTPGRVEVTNLPQARERELWSVSLQAATVDPGEVSLLVVPPGRALIVTDISGDLICRRRLNIGGPLLERLCELSVDDQARLYFPHSDLGLRDGHQIQSLTTGVRFAPGEEVVLRASPVPDSQSLLVASGVTFMGYFVDAE